MKNILSIKFIRTAFLALSFFLVSGSLSADDFRYFLAQHAGSTTNLYEVVLSGSDANLNLITTVPYPAHIAYNEGSNSIFFVREDNANYQSFDLGSSDLSPVQIVNASNGQYVAVSFSDGINLTIGNQSNGKIYSLPADFLGNSLTEIASGPVSGGDVAYDGSDLYLATRSGNRLMKYNGVGFDLLTNIPQKVTGMARTDEGNFILSFFGSTTLKEYTPAGTLVETYNLKLGDAAYTGLNGDFASGTYTEPYSCYASSVVFFNQGNTASGGSVRPERSNPDEALGAPDAQTPSVVADVQNFYSLGFGGTIEVQFSNPIANGPGADIRIWESSASVNNERSLIEVSQDGLGYIPVGEINGDGEVDFGDAFSDFIQFVRITDVTPNNGGGNEYTDGYDVDAVECVHGEYIPCLPNNIVDYAQGTQFDGITPVSTDRSILTNALGMPQMSDATTPESEVNFFTLGFGGFVTYEFEGGIANGPGADVRVYETTFGSSSTDNLANSCARYKERIQGFASQDGCNFWYIGEGCQNTEFDLGYNGAPFTWAKYIKLVDVSDRNDFNPGDDGYDVDGIICLNGAAENTEFEGTFGSATSAELFQGQRRNGSNVAPSRSIKENALGLPQNTDVVNFVSLGFGGKLILKFDFAVFDQAGNDIQIVETSFGNPSCNSYPEKVMVRGSLNGIDYFDIASEDICLDGGIDLASYGPVQYLELTDRSALSDFSGSADGYDVDGVVVLTSCNGEGIDQARISDDVSTPDEIVSLNAFPNPFSNVVTIEISTGENDNTALVEVSNYLGQQVSSERINVASASQTLHNVNARDLQKGIYFITVTTNSSKETLKVIKN